MKPIRIGYFLISTIFAAIAQAGGLPDPANSAGAVDQVEAGNIDAAAQRVGATNLAPNGSLAWYHQSALVLLGRADELKAAGEVDRAKKAAAAAIRMLGQGLTKGGATAKLPDHAQLYLQIARAYDHFFGDRISARRYLLLALQAVPDLADAKNALAAYDAEAARLQQMGGGGN